MDLQIAKWGNSLALRIPADYARRAGLKAGDHVQAHVTADGGLALHPAMWDRQAFTREVDAVREVMPMGSSVMEELRRGGRY